MKTVSVIRWSLFVLGLFLVSAGGAYGQFYPGRVTGTVTDSSGALVPGADVKLTASDIGLERSVTTNTAALVRSPPTTGQPKASDAAAIPR